eukprot:jgi/Botrbrau1/9878/Bobra.0080s0013.1
MTAMSNAAPSQSCVEGSIVACSGPLMDAIEEPNNQLEIKSLPYDYLRLGAPKPPCEADRAIAADLALQQYFREGRLQTNPDFDCMLRVLCTVFGTDTSYISLITGDVIYLPAAHGMIPPGVKCPRERGLCAWTCVSPVNELLVIEDSRLDSRFNMNEHADGRAANIVFYVAAPLISTTGHRMGTLCIAADEPRTFDTQKSVILLNLAELITRKIESALALRELGMTKQSSIIRSIEAYSRAYLFLSVDKERWSILHMNGPAQEMTALTFGSPIAFNSLFKVQDTSQDLLYKHFRMGSRASGSFTISDVQLLGRESKPDSDGKLREAKFSLCFRPAAMQPLDEDSALVGIPAYVRAGTTLGDKYYFVEITHVPEPSWRPTTPEQSSTRRRTNNGIFRPAHIPIKGLTLGSLVGKGGYGRVYAGTYEGDPVAVKVIFDLSKAACYEGLPLEIAMASKISHPNIVRVLAYDMVEDPEITSTVADHGLASSMEGWIVMEFMDRGSLSEAVVKGWMRTEPKLTAPTDDAVVYRLAYDIADAMAAIHRLNIMHGDLTSQNILLQSSSDVAHGFQAKVADFGLARIVNLRMRISSNSYGTVTHVAPEVLTQGILSPVADVYGYGVICWEMVAHSHPWAGMSHAQIVYTVGMMKGQLKFPEDAPPAFVELAKRCMSHDPDVRPSFAEIRDELRARACLDGVNLDGQVFK